MKLSNILPLAGLISLVASHPADRDGSHAAQHMHKRQVQYVTAVTTKQIGTAQYFSEQAQTASTTQAVPTTLVTAVSSNTSPGADTTSSASGGFLDNLFGGGVSIGATASASIGFGSGESSTSSGSQSTSSGSGSSSEVEYYAQQGKGITYSPYTKSGSCKSSDQVKSDLEKLTSYSIIRLYGVDCSGVENALAAINSNQKLFLGIYNIDSSNLQNDLSSMKDAVEGSSRGWDAVDTVSIGNELVNAGTNSASDVVSAIKEARSWFKSNASQYSGSIVSVDTLVAVEGNTDLCDASDYLAVNSHPFWDGNVDPSNSGPWLKQQIANLKSKCGNDKTILITETGWPTQGDSYGSCVPSLSNQLQAIKSIANTLGDQVIMFTTYNDYWKDGGSYGVEKYWGIYGDPSA